MEQTQTVRVELTERRPFPHRLRWLVQLTGDVHVLTFWSRIARRPDCLVWQTPRAVCGCRPCELAREAT